MEVRVARTCRSWGGGDMLVRYVDLDGWFVSEYCGEPWKTETTCSPNPRPENKKPL